MNRLEVGHELACQIADGASPQDHTGFAADLGADLLVLAASHKTRQPHPHQQVVGMTRAWGDEPREFCGAGRLKLPVSWTVAFPLHRREGSIADRVYRAPTRGADMQRSVAL